MAGATEVGFAYPPKVPRRTVKIASEAMSAACRRSFW
jgi:hypothetical protein